MKLERVRKRLQWLLERLRAQHQPNAELQGQIARWETELQRVEHLLDHPLRRWRNGRNISQRQLAELVSVHYMAVRQWESGRFTPAPYHIALLSVITANPELAAEWADWHRKLGGNRTQGTGAAIN